MDIINRNYNFFRWDYWFGQVDSRPLSLFRIVFALILLKDAAYHLPIAQMFYSDDGLVPRSVMPEVWRDGYRFTLMDAMPATWMAQLFFLLWIIVLVCLLVGSRTRLMSVLNFIIILSIHERNPFVLNGADTLMRNLSFFIMFMPLADYYSMDIIWKRWKRAAYTQRISHLRRTPEQHTAYALPVRLVQLQIAYVYLFTFLLKLMGEPWTTGTALHQALQLSNFLLPPGEWMLMLAPPWMLETATYFTLLAEGAFIFLVFLPVFQPQLRLTGLVLGVMLHIGIAVLMSVPNFSLVMIASYILFFEGSWINYLEKRYTSTARSFSMPMPPVGNPLWFLLALTQPEAVRPRSGIQVDHYDGWWVEDDNGKTYISTSAWRFTAAHIPFGHLWSGILQYRIVRRTLWNLGSLWARRLPTITGAPCIAPLSKTPRWQIILPRVLIAAYLIPMIGLITQWNLHQVTLGGSVQPLAPTVEGRARGAVLLVGMYQGWGMFAPFPATPSGWITIPGVFEDEREVNLLTNRPNSDNIIYWRFGPYGRLRKYHESIRDEDRTALLSAYGAYFCRKHNIIGNAPDGERLATLEIQYMRRASINYGQSRNIYEPKTLWRHWCYAEYQY